MVEQSPKFYARITGLLWLIVIIAGSYSQFVGRTPSVDPGNAAATANNILAAANVYRADLIADFLSSASYTGVTVFLFLLLRPVNLAVALLAAAFGMVGVITGWVDSVNHFAPLVLLTNAKFLAVIPPAQLQTMAMAFLKLHGYGITICMVFFGLQCFFNGTLVLRARFLPWFLGVVLLLAGIAYVASSMAAFLAPSLSHAMFPFVAAAGFSGEGCMTLWLLAVGLNAAKWREAANRAAACPAA